MFPFKPFPGLMLNILYLYSCLSSFEKSSYVSSTISWNNESHCLIMNIFFSLKAFFKSLKGERKKKSTIQQSNPTVPPQQELLILLR